MTPATGPLGLQACEGDRRRAATAESDHNGIDYLEVDPGDQRRLRVFFLHPLPGETGAVPSGKPALTRDNVRIEGGVRIRGIEVRDATANGHELVVEVRTAGDFSEYALQIVASPSAATPPAGFDPALSAVAFSFKVTCPTTFDCGAQEPCLPPPDVPADLDYLAKDYDSFLRQATDRLARTLPDWTSHPADAQTALIEALAYTADHLSYQQDARATEAYLTTCRTRIAARRHARLLDYRPADGCSARAWVTFEVKRNSAADNHTLKAGTVLLGGGQGEDPRLAPGDATDDEIAAAPVVFETLTPVRLRWARNEIHFHTWSDVDCCLPAGSTGATFVNDPALKLEAGDVLVLEELVGTRTGLEADADPLHRHPVRLTAVEELTDPVTGRPVAVVAWDEVDALPFPLQISVRPAPGAAPVPGAAARGNVALADHGRTLTGLGDVPIAVGVPPAGDPRPWRPPVPVPELTRVVPLTAADVRRPAAHATALDPAAAVAVLQIEAGGEPWDVAKTGDLLGATGDSRAVVIELERDGSSWLRFGDGVNGAVPAPGSEFVLSLARTGVGSRGNVGRGTINRVVSERAGFTRVRNPLAATGGNDPEDLESIRRAAPVAFRVQQRAVTEADWVEVTQRRADVQRASARIRWTGSWYTVVLMIDRVGGLPVAADPVFLEEITAYLDRFRIAGYDLTVRDPIWIPLDVRLKVCVDADHFRADVHRRLRQVLGAGVTPDGRRGLFHPDNLTFGHPVFVSSIVAAARGVDGVTSATVTRFRQFGHADAGELRAGVLAVGDHEVARLDDDPNAAERGRLELIVEGGR